MISLNLREASLVSAKYVSEFQLGVQNFNKQDFDNADISFRTLFDSIPVKSDIRNDRVILQHWIVKNHFDSGNFFAAIKACDAIEEILAPHNLILNNLNEQPSSSTAADGKVQTENKQDSEFINTASTSIHCYLLFRAWVIKA